MCKAVQYADSAGAGRRCAYTLVEMLVVIGIVAVTAAIIFPVYFAVRAKARQSACINNLHQLGIAVGLYAQDYDGVFPLGGDPADIHTTGWEWAYDGEFWKQAEALKPLQDVMMPYVKSRQVWDCPSDVGFTDGPAYFDHLSTAPSSFAEYGSSYYYHTELALRHMNAATATAYDDYPPYYPHGPSEISVLSDGSGSWHGGIADADNRSDVLMADGHVVAMTNDQVRDAMNVDLVWPPSGAP